MKAIRGQMSIFDVFPLEQVGMTERERFLEQLVKRGAFVEKSKIRILNYYADKQASVSEFAKFLSDEYGLSGAGGEFGSVDFNAKGIRLWKRGGEKYTYDWKEFAKKAQELIESDRYFPKEDLPEPEYFDNPDDPNWATARVYDFSHNYDGRKIVMAYLHSVAKTDLRDNVRFKNEYFNNRYQYTHIYIHELKAGIQAGAYDTVEEIWEDIELSGRRIQPTSFGGRRWMDEDAVKKYLDNWKRNGYVTARGETIYPTDEGHFYHFRLRVKRGEIAKCLLDYRKNKRICEEEGE